MDEQHRVRARERDGHLELFLRDALGEASEAARACVRGRDDPPEHEVSGSAGLRAHDRQRRRRLGEEPRLARLGRIVCTQPSDRVRLELALAEPAPVARQLAQLGLRVLRLRAGMHEQDDRTRIRELLPCLDELGAIEGAQPAGVDAFRVTEQLVDHGFGGDVERGGVLDTRPRLDRARHRGPRVHGRP